MDTDNLIDAIENALKARASGDVKRDHDAMRNVDDEFQRAVEAAIGRALRDGRVFKGRDFTDAVKRAITPGRI